MKYIQLAMLLVALCINNAYANQCSSNQSQNNQLIQNTYNLQDTSPFFKKHEFLSYKPNSQDVDINDYSINGYANKLRLNGNSWKSVKLKEWFVVESNSYLEFQFLSNGDEAEVNGLGLILRNATGYHGSRFFQIHGTQTVPSYVQDYHNYSGNKWITYRIPLWQHFQNTSNKIVEQIVFAGDDDGTQVNQNVYYKNIKLIEDYTEYTLPASFDHGPVVIQPTTNKNYFHHIYPQTITGPDQIDYPVSGGSIVKRVYSPPNTNIEDVILVKENYYENMCWDQGINFNSTTLATHSMSSLQALAFSQNDEIDSFKDQQPVVLTQQNNMYFDPDLQVNNQNKSRFINKSSIISNESLAYYYETRESATNQVLKSGFVLDHVVCTDPGTGQDTKGACYDLNGLTEYSNTSNSYLADTGINGLTIVNIDGNTELNTPPYTETSFTVMSDMDNKWNEDSLKQQTTEVLINTQNFNNYIKYLNNNSSIESIIGFKPESIINSPKSSISNAAYSSATKKVYFSPVGTDYFGNYMTFSRDVGVVAHEFTHAISNKWFSGQLREGSVQGCAINEGFSDIMGYGTKLHSKGNYDPRWSSDAYDNVNEIENGLRNSANPLLTNDDSVFTGSANQTATCVYPPPGDSCPNVSICGPPDITPASGYKYATIITHLYHLMTHGGFNALSTHRPDPFGVSPDEIFNHKGAEKHFFDAMALGHGPNNSTGSEYTFCELRNNMISVVGDTDKVKVNQAWKQVYQDLDSDSTDDGDGKKCQLPVGTELLKPEISITNVSSNNSNVSDGGGIYFGFLDPGFSRTYTLEIKNEGDYKLRLINPEISVVGTGSFSQSGLNNQQLSIDVGDSSNISITFTGSSNNYGLNHRTLTFQTNHPDHELFTINLSGTTNPPQGNADAYEDDDSQTSTNLYVFGFQESTTQNRNFEDDSFDWFSYTPNAIGCVNGSRACKFKFTELNSPMNIYDSNKSFSVQDAIVNNEYIVFGGKGAQFRFSNASNASNNNPQTNSDYTVEIDCGCY